MRPGSRTHLGEGPVAKSTPWRLRHGPVGGAGPFSLAPAQPCTAGRLADSARRAPRTALAQGSTQSYAHGRATVPTVGGEPRQAPRPLGPHSTCPTPCSLRPRLAQSKAPAARARGPRQGPLKKREGACPQSNSWPFKNNPGRAPGEPGPGQTSAPGVREARADGTHGRWEALQSSPLRSPDCAHPLPCPQAAVRALEDHAGQWGCHQPQPTGRPNSPELHSGNSGPS